MGIFLIILILLFLAGPFVWRRWIQPWLILRAQRKMEDYIRAAAGMPPRDGKRRASSGPEREERTGKRRRSRGYGYTSTGPLIPKEYAVDVEFTETKEYSSTTEITGEEHGHRRQRTARVEVESQVSDVEFTEVRYKR